MPRSRFLFVMIAVVMVRIVGLCAASVPADAQGPDQIGIAPLIERDGPEALRNVELRPVDLPFRLQQARIFQPGQSLRLRHHALIQFRRQDDVQRRLPVFIGPAFTLFSAQAA